MSPGCGLCRASSSAPFIALPVPIIISPPLHRRSTAFPFFPPGKKLFGRSHTHKVAQSRAKALNEYLKVLVDLPDKISQSKHVVSFFEANELDIKPPSKEERDRRQTPLLQRVVTGGGGDKEERPSKEMVVGDGKHALRSWLLRPTPLTRPTPFTPPLTTTTPPLLAAT